MECTCLSVVLWKFTGVSLVINNFSLAWHHSRTCMVNFFTRCHDTSVSCGDSLHTESLNDIAVTVLDTVFSFTVGTSVAWHGLSQVYKSQSLHLQLSLSFFHIQAVVRREYQVQSGLSSTAWLSQAASLCLLYINLVLSKRLLDMTHFLETSLS